MWAFPLIRIFTILLHICQKCWQTLHLYSVEIFKLNSYLGYFQGNILFYFIFRWFLLRSGSQGSAMMTLIICSFQHQFSRWSQGSRDCSLNIISRKKPWQWRSSGSWPTVASEWVQFAAFISFKDILGHGQKPVDGACNEKKSPA